MKTNKKKGLPKTLTYKEFLSRAKVFVKVYRASKQSPFYTAEITNGWLFKNNFYLRVEGVSTTPESAIRSLLNKLQGEKLWLNIEDASTKRYFEVPPTIVYEVTDTQVPPKFEIINNENFKFKPFFILDTHVNG